VKTTLEIPDAVFRKAKSRAAEQGIPVREFITRAVEEKLRVPTLPDKPWNALAGRLRRFKKETARINGLIEREFEGIEPQEWV
jgi:hypothetical protein